MKKLVIIGTGLHHVRLLLTLSQHALDGVHVTLVAPSLRQFYGPMLADFVAGLVSREDGLIDLEPVLKNTGIRWLPLRVTALDVPEKTLTLSDGRALVFDWLCLSTADAPDLGAPAPTLPGAQAHGLWLHPSDAFTQRWPAVLAQAARRSLRIAVLGDSVQGVVMALAARQRLPNAALTLVMAGAAALPTRWVQALKQGRITVLDDRVLALSEGTLTLGCGATLVCDHRIVALRRPPPAWLTACTLTLTPQGALVTDKQHRAVHHPTIFSADGAAGVSWQTVWRRGAAQTAAETALACALIAALQDGLPPRAKVPNPIFSLTARGATAVLACWGQPILQGALWWRLKHRLDRAAVERMRTT